MAGGLVSGFTHPLLGPDHMLAMVAVGIWGAFLGRPLVIVLPILFPLLMAVGGAAALAGVPVPPAETGIAVSLIVLGLVIALSVRAPILPACAVVAVFAFFHGYAHGTELPLAASPLGYTMGFVAATGLLHLAGITLGLLHAHRTGRWTLRAAGAAIALSGPWFLFGAPL